MRIVLASGSPQRREILARLGFEFEVIESGAAETSGGDPAEDVRVNARRKVDAVARRLGDRAASRTIIGCDTDVVHEGTILGKPATADEAREFLRRLSGEEHEVLSAVAVLEGGELREGTARSVVRFRELGEAVIDSYVASGEWRGRAGGYAIQGRGSGLVAAVEGDVSNVIGLPVPVLFELAPGLDG